jgi:hypothetical protein
MCVFRNSNSFQSHCQPKISCESNAKIPQAIRTNVPRIWKWVAVFQ